MASSHAPGWTSIQAQEYAAAESMLQHSRSARSNSQAANGFQMADNYKPVLDTTQPPVPRDQIASVLVQAYPHFRQPFQPASAQEQSQGFGQSFGSELSSPHDLQTQFDQQDREHHSELSQSRKSDTPYRGRQGSISGHRNHGSSSIEGSEPTSPIGTRNLNKRHLDQSESWTHRSSNDNTGHQDIKDENDKKPAWSELKTKAGKERKRLPLACIACRRKKIRCSGEKPSCKHCMRSRIPCVYKVTQRKAAPRTDYMAMLDKRLKRMEERVIKIIPKEEMTDPSLIPRAIIKPSSSNHTTSGKKRGADEAFGPQLDDWAQSKDKADPLKGQENGESKVNTEGAEFLPSPELQNHLSEVFFDNLYGQSYHLLHKPSYMRRLRYCVIFTISRFNKLT